MRRLPLRLAVDLREGPTTLRSLMVRSSTHEPYRSERLMTTRIALAAGALLASLAFAPLAAARPLGHDRATRARIAVAQPDEVIRWNQELQTLLVAPGAQAPSIHPTRPLAITQIAVYDAINGIVGGGEPLLTDLHAPRS